MIGRYSGAQPEEAPLHKLGSGQWDKAKARAARQVRDTAAELLALYAKRAARLGHSFSINQHDLEAFADGFGFEETADMPPHEAVSPTWPPASRWTCWCRDSARHDRVALRAAFVAIADRKQVAILCPTTLLAEQHLQTFGDRFADWPVRIAELSRFRTSKESAEVLKGLQSGAVDIVIGTHKLLGKDVKLARLGLVIIDEEHRFGVRQKEALKRLRAEVDVLTLTATPIPRTLANVSCREYSTSGDRTARRSALPSRPSSPPGRGLILRGGNARAQARRPSVLPAHEVDSIERMRERLVKLLPEARVAVAHARCRERESARHARLQRTALQRAARSTIIETGLESRRRTPSSTIAPTSSSWRSSPAARAGRSLAPPGLRLPAHPAEEPSTRTRRSGSMRSDDGGARLGVLLAMHDLEIRGAGEVLGESQSGEIQEVGFSLYARMLDKAS